MGRLPGSVAVRLLCGLVLVVVLVPLGFTASAALAWLSVMASPPPPRDDAAVASAFARTPLGSVLTLRVRDSRTVPAEPGGMDAGPTRASRTYAVTLTEPSSGLALDLDLPGDEAALPLGGSVDASLPAGSYPAFCVAWASTGGRTLPVVWDWNADLRDRGSAELPQVWEVMGRAGSADQGKERYYYLLSGGRIREVAHAAYMDVPGMRAALAYSAARRF